MSLSTALEIGGNFLGLVMIPFKLLTAELSSDFSLPGAASPSHNDDNDFWDELTLVLFQVLASSPRALVRGTSQAVVLSPVQVVASTDQGEGATLLLSLTHPPAPGSTTGRCTT